MAYYQSQEWMEETDQLPSRDEVLEYTRSQILDEINNYNTNNTEEEINNTFYELYINFLNNIEEDDIIYMQEVFDDIIFNIIDNSHLTQDTIIKILEKYISHGFIIENFVDNPDDKNNIIMQFATNYQRYKVIDYLLSTYPKRFDDTSIKLIIKNLKTYTKKVLNQNFFKQNNQDVLQIIINQSYDYFEN
tara:strand:- start:3197 stop:3766 length:570 start_codon:yes stop_codon:yes gene_type:complete